MTCNIYIKIKKIKEKICELAIHACTKMAKNPTQICSTPPYWYLCRVTLFSPVITMHTQNVHLCNYIENAQHKISLSSFHIIYHHQYFFITALVCQCIDILDKAVYYQIIIHYNGFIYTAFMFSKILPKTTDFGAFPHRTILIYAAFRVTLICITSGN